MATDLSKSSNSIICLTIKNDHHSVMMVAVMLSEATNCIISESL